LRLSWPLTAINFAQVAFNVTAVIFMGRLGPGELAGGVLGAAFFNAVSVFTVNLVAATAPLIAAEIGRNTRATPSEIRRTFSQGIWTAFAAAVPFIVMLVWSEELLVLAGQDPVIARHAAEYLAGVSWGLLPMLGFTVIRSFLSAVERLRLIWMVGLTAIACNAALIYTLSFGAFGFPALGLQGTGLAIAVTWTLMLFAGALAIQISPHLRAYRLLGRLLRQDWPRFLHIWRIGFPAALTLAFEVTAFSAAFVVMGIIGADTLAAHGIALQIVTIAYMIPLGISQAASIRIGRAWGGGDHVGIARAGGAAFAVAMTVSSFVAIGVIFFPEFLVGLFIDLSAPESANVASLTLKFLGLAAVFQLVDAAQVVGIGMLRGLHDTKVPMILAAAGYWLIGLPVGAALAFLTELQGTGVWIGMTASLGVLAALSLTRWHMRDRLGLTRPTKISELTVEPAAGRH
jgi:MATE family multidrug resistance protein